MDQRTARLSKRLEDQGIAEKLVAAGLTTPRKIKAATDQMIKAIPGIGAVALALIRNKIG